ncbi:MAG TPA: response regulator, partial [Gammaproteobacteria bacterium]|nr:response regulator [Gammaproteobacteria bacterium]
MKYNATVFVIEDDYEVSQALACLFASVNLSVEVFASADEFMEKLTSKTKGCIVADIRMPGMNGLDLQEALKKAHYELPIIFITAHGDIPMAIKAIKGGAIDF